MKQAMRSLDFQVHLKVLASIDFRQWGIMLDPEKRQIEFKLIAFRIGQCLALVEGRELYDIILMNSCLSLGTRSELYQSILLLSNH